MESTIAVIAGSGRFPFHVAKEARRLGLRVVGIGMKGWVDKNFQNSVDAYEEIEVGKLGQLLSLLKQHAITQAIMAGKVTKSVLFHAGMTFDAEALRIVQKTTDASVPSLLGAIGERLSQAGVHLLDSSIFLKDSLCPEGPATPRSPTAAEKDDIAVGIQAARALAHLDIGQTVVVKNRVVVAVEALEGTDSAIRRAYSLAGKGLVVVKMASLKQDRRFDLPVVGTETIAVLQEVSATCLAVEAHATMLLDRATLLTQARTADLCIVGVVAPKQ